jgi:hypothetical protein
MTSPSSGYRAVCPLCKTVLVTVAPRGVFADFDAAVKAMRGHLRFSCDVQDTLPPMSKRELEIVSENSIEAIEGAA